MSNPPICNYEGSDYQSSFWDQGGRAYEDAVEEKALQKLLPASGKLMLELGAGAGRNTPRYKNYEKIVLLDYSHTQLEQARDRLGESERYVYVAADVYHLPFVSNLFDGATMIRTLHHMADARLALAQVADVLQHRAVFILEFANKHNLKAILRYALKKQTWNPNSPEPVEFAALNFDFHPQTVRSWLNSLDFVLEKTLTVSHFRMNFFKKVFPLDFLVWMDSAAQLTSEWWQLTPSIFTRSSLKTEKESAPEGSFFRCPKCGAALQDTPPLLKCPCGQSYPVEGGIYDFRIKS